MVTPEVSLADHDRPTSGGRMEIVTEDGGRVMVGADVDAGALARVLEVLGHR